MEITVESGSLIVRSVATPRAGWADAFREMARQGDDALLDDVSPVSTPWDESKWEW